MDDLARHLPSLKGILFDLDNTLYPPERGVFSRVNERIELFVRGRLSLEEGEARSLRRRYVSRYGTTLAGLLANGQADPAEYLEFVHDVPVEDLIAPDPALDAFLSRIRLPMLVFTNASARHAGRVLATLGVGRLFSGVCALEDLDFVGKPNPGSYALALGRLGLPPREALFVDDEPEYVAGAAAAGIPSVLVSPHSPAGVRAVARVTDLSRFFTGAPWFSP